MGFSFRKSVNLGLVKLNLSKSGLGVSFGVKGFRVSKNKRGTNLAIGTKGMYYRKHYGNAAKTKAIEEIEEKNINTEPEKIYSYDNKFCRHCGMEVLIDNEYCPFCGALNCIKFGLATKIMTFLISITLFLTILTDKPVFYLLLAILMLFFSPILIVRYIVQNIVMYIKIRKSNNLKLFKKVNYLVQGADYNAKNT